MKAGAEIPGGADIDHWQAELLWQFLLHAERAGVDLSKFSVQAGPERLALDRVFARGIELYHQRLFNGFFMLDENSRDDVQTVGRKVGAPIDHAAETIRALTKNLREKGGAL